MAKVAPNPQALSEQTDKKFWQGTNFYMALGLLILSASTLAMDQAQAQLTFLIEGVVAGIYLIRQVATGKFSFKNFQDKNGWNYLAQLILLVSPQFADLVPGLQKLTEALVAKDWGAVISALFSIGTILYYLVSNKGNRAEVARLGKSVVGLTPGL